MVAIERPEESARQWFRAIVRGLIEDADSFRQPDIAREALDLAKKHKRRYRELIEETTYSAAYEVVRQLVAETRARRGLHVVGDTAFTKQAAERKFAERHPRFWSWVEHAGERSFLLPKMRREEVLLAADERDERGKYERIIGRWLRMIADGLEGDQAVEERFSEEEVAALYAKAEKETK